MMLYVSSFVSNLIGSDTLTLTLETSLSSSCDNISTVPISFIPISETRSWAGLLIRNSIYTIFNLKKYQKIKLK